MHDGAASGVNEGLQTREPSFAKLRTDSANLRVESCESASWLLRIYELLMRIYEFRRNLKA